jgi:hypothetical protein
LVIPIDLRTAKALPRNCCRRPLAGRRTPGEGGFLFLVLCGYILKVFYIIEVNI